MWLGRRQESVVERLRSSYCHLQWLWWTIRMLQAQTMELVVGRLSSSYCHLQWLQLAPQMWLGRRQESVVERLHSLSLSYYHL